MYVFCEWDSVQGVDGLYQETLIRAEREMRAKCLEEWKPKTFGHSSPHSGQFGRTTILPELFDDHSAVQMSNWRQTFTAAGHQTLIAGAGSSNTIPEEFKISWVGLAFPNKQMNISEIRWQIGDRKYGRINIEALHAYKKPALIFKEPYTIDEEQSFDLYGYVDAAGISATYPAYVRIVMLGAAYYKMIDKVLGNCGAVIT